MTTCTAIQTSSATTKDSVRTAMLKHGWASTDWNHYIWEGNPPIPEDKAIAYFLRYQVNQAK